MLPGGLGVGAFVREARKKKNWTISDLSKHSTVSTCTISNIETGARRNPREQTIRKLMETLEIDEQTIEKRLAEQRPKGVSSMQELYGVLWSMGLSSNAVEHIAKTVQLWKRVEKR
ncbi:MAG: helix-turn-helix domain-containing protein [Actinobacteria bacterium]|nr:helix-turn-helix domain-containing protein [Actinomycetota bacterium]MBU4218965.1 helix-turn-helix domain-containing protein [Actinomycetota bacterium]MBU4358047.1 helix-turn-helix domain-containing protein [Actinomycetota bacterium]MBU4401463.1 helix-turn-helix domain-containing protein [Actinomycetota bacterium]